MRPTIYTIYFIVISLTLWINPLNANPVTYEGEIKTILDHRCVSCHSCYTAPCQLKLSNYEGILRGLSKKEVYSPSRLTSMEPSRLGIDATGETWRHDPYDFASILPGAVSGDKENSTDYISVLVRQRKLHPIPLKGEKEWSDNSRSCPTSARELHEHLESRKNGGMPYGLPPLQESEISLLTRWISEGASGSDRKEMYIPNEDLDVVRSVESYFYSNMADEYGRLINRYIFEHIYLGHLFTSELSASKGRFYRLIRSRTRCELFQPGDEIATRRSWNLPGEIGERDFHYCMTPVTESITHKDHIVYKMDGERIARYSELFPLKDEVKPGSPFFSSLWYSIRNFPSILKSETGLLNRKDYYASNPFEVYLRIPVQARYDFILDDLNFYITNFIRGPVCRGSVAVNAIDEQFWVYMIRPESDLMVRKREFADQASNLLFLPARAGSDSILGVIPEIIENRKSRNKYRRLRLNYYRNEFPDGYSLSDIWDGTIKSHHHPSPSEDSVLTVFRHYDSANVERGNIGPTPKTLFVMDYAIVERLYYALVAGFDVFGDLQHQLSTRFYMDYLRMESEELFLSFLPGITRDPLRNSWYQQANGLSERVDEMFFSTDYLQRHFPQLGLDHPTAIHFKSRTPEKQKRELLSLIHTHLKSHYSVMQDPLNPDRFEEKTDQVNQTIGTVRSLQDFENNLAKLMTRKTADAPYVNFFPDHSFILLTDESGDPLQAYTLIRNKTHSNVLWLDSESKRRTPQDDILILYRGVTGSYPNMFFEIPLSRGRDFLQLFRTVKSKETYNILLSLFGRTPDNRLFWQTYDRIQQFAFASLGFETGIIDLSRYAIPSDVDTPGWKGEREEQNSFLKRSIFGWH